MSEIISSNLPQDFTLTQPDELMRVKDFFNGRNVFITGGTGFMGQVLIEKLMWSCEDIGSIYVMLRGKRGIDVRKRLDDLVNSEIFDRIRNRNEESIKKLIGINGDINEKDLGLSDEDRQTLHSEVSVVFHAAATVRFEEPLDRAIILNVRGTRDVLELSTDMKQLKAFVYVSTTYTNTDKKIIEERVYTKDADWKTYVKLAEECQHDMNSFRGKVLGFHPNTYTFTKYLAENVVYDYRHIIPVIIFRPSIVSFCLEDPLPGWVCNFNGPIGIWVGVITGVIHVHLCKATGVNDYIPCDYAINALILSAWYRGNTKTNECVTINAASGDKKKISPEVLFDLAYAALEKYPPEKMLSFPAFKGIQNYSMYIFLFVVTQLIPAIIYDILFSLKGINFRIMPIYRKIYSMNRVLYHFCFNEWSIVTSNYYTLNSFMDPEDRKVYKLDVDFDEVDASYIMIKGFKRFVLNENCDEKSLQIARKRFIRMYIFDCFIKGLLLMSAGWILYLLIVFILNLSSLVLA